MVIENLNVKNFRSIVSAEVPLKDMNVIVGFNDIGKSNLLKALNLFFNDETDIGKKLDFEEDYSFYAPVRQKMAKEITIELHIKPPSNYSLNEVISWKKIWRKGGLVREEIQTVSGSEIPPRSKIFSWLKNLSYKYVPAVKSEIYFQNLLGDLHDTLSTTISETLKNAGIEFIGKIKENTEQITININRRLGFKSDIQLPANLKELFKTLDFRTINGAFEVSLQKRGDGIKTRHIPVILHFLAEQENKNRSSGSPRVNSIWGYEEPENNLELSKAYELAHEFIDYSNDIQILTTTHSPAFYSLINNREKVNGYLAQIVEQKTSYVLLGPNGINEMNEHMGILEIVTPYINDEVEKRKVLHETIQTLQKEISEKKRPTIFVEGITDKIILESYLKLKPLKKEVNIETSKEEGGAVYVHNMVCAWSYLKSNLLCIGLFDRDIPGGSYKKKLIDNSQVQDALHKKRVAVKQWDPPQHLLPIFKKHIALPVSIEEMFPYPVWQYAENKNWLEERTTFQEFIKLDMLVEKSIKQYFREQGFNADEMRYLLYRVKEDCKQKFAAYVSSISTNSSIFSGFEKFHSDINSLL